MSDSQHFELAQVSARGSQPEVAARTTAAEARAARVDETTPRQARIALAATAALLLACVLCWTPGAKQSDFGAMYVAGYIVGHGEGAQLYDLTQQQKIQRAVLDRDRVLPFLHPPFVAPVFSRLAALPYWQAYFIWDSANILLWIGFVILMRRFIPVPRQTFRYFLVCFLFWPCWVVLIQGQTSFIVLLAYALCFASLQQGHEFRGGAFLGLGLVKYHFVVPFILICLLRRKWRLIAGFASVGFALVIASTAVVGWRGMLSYAGQVLGAVRNPAFPGVHTYDWPSLVGLLGTLIPGQTGTGWPRAVAAAAAALLILVAAWRWRNEDSRENGGSQDLAFAASMAVAVVSTPYLYFHDLSLILLPLLLALASPQWREQPAWRFVLIACTAGLYIPPVWLLLVDFRRLYLLCPLLLAFTLALFALLGRRSQPARSVQLVPSVAD